MNNFWTWADTHAITICVLGTLLFLVSVEFIGETCRVLRVWSEKVCWRHEWKELQKVTRRQFPNSTIKDGEIPKETSLTTLLTCTKCGKLRKVKF